MRIPEMLLDGVVFLYPTIEAAEKHAKIGGTGFLMGKRVFKDGRATKYSVPYLVTNKHVAASCSVLRLNRRDGKEPDVYEMDERLWRFHPEGDDIAIIPILGILDLSQHKSSFGHVDFFITKEKAEEYQIGVGEEVCMIGRFVNHQGRRDSLAAARFGSVSVMPQLIYNNAVLKDQLSYAVEMRSRTGFSGSPVMVYRTPATVLTSEVKVGDFWGILGINWGYIVDEDGENTWLNAVIPAWRILDVLEGEDLKSFHAFAEAGLPEDADSAVPAIASSNNTDPILVPVIPSHKED